MGKKKPVARDEENVGGAGKSRKKAVVIDDDEYSIGTEMSEEKSVQGEENAAPVGGKKKGKKGKNTRLNEDAEDVDDDGDDGLEIQFAGKKKSKPKGKQGGNSFAASGFALLGDKDADEEEDDDVSEEDVSVVFGGKKKSSKAKKGGSLFTGSAFDAIGDDDDDDLELKQQLDQEDDEDEEPVISFTGKKKSSKANKKPSGSVFSMLEEEEKLRKEEEERLRKEEEERQAEERKRLKKEREKEKMLKKKQEGKLLTAKQKAEAQRLELMRNQFLAKTGGLPQPTGETSTHAPTKRPKYVTKKSKPQQHANVNGQSSTSIQDDNVSELDSVDADKADDVDTENVDEKTEAPAVEQESGNKEDDESDEEWDAKSWDGADLKLPGVSAFGDEEEAAEPEPAPAPVVKKEVKTKEVPQNQPAPVVANKGKQKAVNGKKEDKEEEEEEGEKTLRSPICCIMGHVDTGKTKLLDCIRRTNVQEGEAGGITQQIGATYIPADNIRERTKELKADAKLNVPGLLVIDTPGHESFKNLRSRGSGLCDIAILVVDIMHGLEPQTIESLNLLRMRNTEFIVALNKVDRLYGWKVCRNAPIGKAMKLQSRDVQLEFEHRLTQIITQFKEQGINTELYSKNKERGETYSIVPTSAISGEGIPEMLLLLVQWAQKTMVEKLTYSNEIQCTVLEVKVIEGLGTTIDVVLVNGVLHEGDEIVVCGFQGPIHTTIRSLLTPHPMKELRVKGAYIHHKEIKAAQGIKITGQNLEHAVAGTALYVVGPDDDVEEIKESVMDDMRNVMSRIDKSGEGVYVQASTLGSLEALLEFLKTPVVSIPVSGIGIGPVHKKDVMKASVMLEKKKEYATILAFDVKVTPEARELADDIGVKIFIADIIYHLFDQFKAYIDNLKEEKKREAAEDAVFPCVLQIMPNCVFNKKDPIILGVDVIEGILKIGTPICIPQRDFIDIGRISSIENNHKPVDYAKKGQKVAIKITGSNAEEQQKMFGRHFEMEDELVSHISRNSIDILKANYRDELTNEEWKLVVKLKHLFKIQ
ncbi:putative protein-synthesizing GTPase [Helianthus annuus]|nr:putative protein-synthesizing GTPase [Helianthus annuus]